MIRLLTNGPATRYQKRNAQSRACRERIAGARSAWTGRRFGGGRRFAGLEHSTSVVFLQGRSDSGVVVVDPGVGERELERVALTVERPGVGAHATVLTSGTGPPDFITYYGVTRLVRSNLVFSARIRALVLGDYPSPTGGMDDLERATRRECISDFRTITTGLALDRRYYSRRRR